MSRLSLDTNQLSMIDIYIELNREDGMKARIIFGRGLDFMKSDGSIKSTFIVIQDPID